MDLYDKFFKKYAGKDGDVILPPPPEDELLEEYLSPDLKSPIVPVIKEMSEEEMEKWDRYVEKQNKLKENLNILKSLESPVQEDVLSPEMGTIPAIPKKASVDKLLSLCEKYYKLANK